MKQGKEKKWALAIGCVCLMAWLGLTVFSTAALAAESFKARYSYHWFPTHHLAVYSEKFAQLAKEETKGRLEVTTYPSGQLYSARRDCRRFSRKRRDGRLHCPHPGVGGSGIRRGHPYDALRQL